MVIRRCMMLLFVVILTVDWCAAFFATVHFDITTQALTDLVDKNIWTPPENVRKALNGRGFTLEAIREIGNANMALDTTDCPVNYFRVSNADDVPVTPCTILGSELAAANKVAELGNPEEHFDDELIQVANSRLLGRRRTILTFLREHRYVAARKELGFALHAIQDFYSHTNWVDMVLRGEPLPILEPRLGEGSFLTGVPRLAKPDPDPTKLGEPTCYTINGDLSKSWERSTLPPVSDPPLTSGYYKDDVPEGKCAHGDLFLRGINKDTSLQKLREAYADRYEAEVSRHETAFRAAYLHTMRYVIGLLNEKEVQADPLTVVGFLGYPTISRLSPSKNYAGEDGFEFEVLGKDFADQSVIVWNETELKTEFINNGMLRTHVDKSALAAPGTAKVSVKSPRDKINISMGGTPLPFVPLELLSNELPFTIDKAAAPPDCPGPVTRHNHSNMYLDVNAQRWNDTGLIVKPEDRVDIRILAGLIIWRRGLLGSDSIAAPEGDRRANPGNTLLWIDPQIPINVAPIGAAIGMILPAESTGTPTEKPEGATYFPILNGGVFDMKAGGKLFLGVNDGAFFNNSGCFQAKITRITK